MKKIRKEQNKRREEAVQSLVEEINLIHLEAVQSIEKWAARVVEKRQEIERIDEEMEGGFENVCSQ